VHKLTTGSIGLAMMLSPFLVRADPHPLQLQLLVQLDAAMAKQQDATKAGSGKRQQLIGEHMQMLLQTMQLMQETKPQAGMSAQEYAEWLIEDQRLMDEFLQQMITDLQLMQDEK
jgi:hypothetical protein